MPVVWGESPSFSVFDCSESAPRHFDLHISCVLGPFCRILVGRERFDDSMPGCLGCPDTLDVLCCPHIIDAGMVTIPFEKTTTVIFPEVCCPFCFRGSPGGVLTGQAMLLFKHKPLQSPCICKTVPSGRYFRKWPPPETPIFHFLTDGREKGRIRHFLRKKRKNPSFSLRDCEIRFFCLHFRVHLCPFLCVCV